MTATDNGGYVMGGKKRRKLGKVFGVFNICPEEICFVFDRKLIGYSRVCQRFHVVFTI